MNNTSLKNLPTLFLQAALIATATVLALVLVTRYVSPIPLSISQTTTNKESAFSASGKSTITTIPDRAEIILGISLREDDIKQAQSKANTIINKINTDIQTLGVKKDDIKTQSYSINPIYDYQSGNQRITGYSVDIILNVSLDDFEKLNKVVDAATQAGANQVNSIQFKLSDDKEAEIKGQARAQAIEDAKRTAQELAKLAGMKLGKVINVIEEPEASTPGPYFAADMAVKGTGGGAPTNVQPGSTRYSYTVTVSYETL